MQIWTEERPGFSRRNSISVGVNDLRPGDKIFDVVGCSGALHLHLTETKFRMRYLGDSETLISQGVFEMGFRRKINDAGEY